MQYGSDSNFSARPARALSLSYYTVPDLTPEETVEVAARNGMEFVGLRLLGGQPGGTETSLVSDAGVRRRMRGRLRECDVRALDANTARLVPTTNVAAFAPMLDVAAELGASHLLATADDDDRARLKDNLFALCLEAEARALTVDLEFVPWLAVPDIDAAAALLRDVAHPCLGIAVDALHFHRSGSSLSSLAGMPAEWFRYVQICDAADSNSSPSRDELIHEATRERLAPGDGAIDLAALLDAMPPDLPLALEVPQATLAEDMAAVERVARLVQATRRLLEAISARR